MKRIGAAACGMLLAIGVAAGSALAQPSDKKPVRKPVIDLGNSAKQRRPGQVMPGDAGPAPSAPAAKPEAPPQQPATPTPPPPVTQQPAPIPAPAAPIPSAEPRKAILPPPKLHAGVAAVSSTPASAQVRHLGVVGTGSPGARPSDAPWTELTAAWTDDAPIEVRVGVHAPVVLRITGAADAGGSEPAPPTLITLWPMARVMIGPEFVDGRWIPGVRLVRGQVTVQPESAGASSVLPGAWSSAVRTPDRLVPVGGAGGRVAYDTVRGTRMWSLVVE